MLTIFTGSCIEGMQDKICCLYIEVIKVEVKRWSFFSFPLVPVKS